MRWRAASFASRTTLKMSSRVIRPSSPVPLTRFRSTPTSRAKRRTAGPAGTTPEAGRGREGGGASETGFAESGSAVSSASNRASRTTRPPAARADLTASKAFLRTSNWSYRVGTWYFYFRRIDFPSDPEIDGRWEWAGIYFGEKS